MIRRRAAGARHEGPEGPQEQAGAEAATRIGRRVVFAAAASILAVVGLAIVIAMFLRAESDRRALQISMQNVLLRVEGALARRTPSSLTAIDDLLRLGKDELALGQAGRVALVDEGGRVLAEAGDPTTSPPLLVPGLTLAPALLPILTLPPNEPHDIAGVVAISGRPAGRPYRLILLVPRDVYYGDLARLGTFGAMLFLVTLIGLGLAVHLVDRRLSREDAAAAAARAALAAKEARYRAILQAALDAVVTIDERNRVTFWNPAATRLFGFTAQEALGRDITVLLLPRLDPPALAALAAIAEAQGGGALHETAARRRDGTLMPVEIAASLATDARAPEVLFIRDIGARKQAEAELTQALDRAEESNRLKSDFLANMSHEIRTPLNSVLGFAQIALRHETGAEQRARLEKIRAAGRHLLALLNDILDLSKIEAGMLTLAPERFRLSGLIQEVADAMGARAAAKGLTFAWRIMPDVPGEMIGDRLRLGQILNNLIDNALKFTESGRIDLSVRWDGSPADGQMTLAFAVADSGVGIAPDQAARLFQPFTQGDGSRTRRYGGTGLGLAICRRLVALMDGEIGVTSVPGRGATFRFTGRFGMVPDARPDLPPGLAPVPKAGQMTPEMIEAGLAGLSVLLVEDNAVNQEVARELLAAAGVAVVVAGNGAEALARLNEAGASFDIVLMDVQMPVMDGLEATRRIRAEARFDRLPVIAMTAHAFDEERERCFTAGMDDHLAKPIALDRLYEALYFAVTRGRSLAAIDAAPEARR